MVAYTLFWIWLMYLYTGIIYSQSQVYITIHNTFVVFMYFKYLDIFD